MAPTLIVLTLTIANAVLATLSDQIATDSAGETSFLDSPSNYLPVSREVYLKRNEQTHLLDVWLKQLRIPRKADAGTILARFEAADDNLEFVELSKDVAHLDCKSIKQNIRKITMAYNLRKGTSGSIENFLLFYGARAYGFCARKFNREFKAAAEPFPGEGELDRMVAFATEPELELDQCAAVGQEELFKRARQVKLTSAGTKVQRMLEAASSLQGFSDVATEPQLAASNLQNFLNAHCRALAYAFGDELRVIGSAYVFGGDDLTNFQPRLLKLLEYRRICLPASTDPKKTRKLLEQVFVGKSKNSLWNLLGSFTFKAKGSQEKTK